MSFWDRPGRLDEYDPTHAVFRDLMSYRVREVLLVSSAYDSYILEEDGQLSESLDAEFYQLNLLTSPRITQVSTAEETLALLEKRPFDLVITMARLGGVDPRALARRIKAAHPELPVVLLADNHFEAHRVKEANQPGALDQVFVWRGDVALFLAIIKLIEDARNVARDTELAAVRTIILIENSVRFYSSYLPLLYTEMTKQTQALMADGVNVRQQLRRMRARTKILLAETFEQGWELFERYRAYTLGIITDARFPRAGVSDPEAGLEFVRRVKAEDPDMPLLVQSTDAEMEPRAHALGAAFLHKRSPRLLDELRRFIKTSLGFGDFVFVRPEDGSEVARVPDLAAMPRVLRTVPGESLRYHAARNHFSNWCMARTEFTLAARIRPWKVSDFADVEELRRYLVEAFSELASEARRGVVADFSPQAFEGLAGFLRIGSGSMGGKGRGLGFINALLARSQPGDGEVRIFVPPAVVLGTDLFDEFLQTNNLVGLALSEASDLEIEDAFLGAPLPAAIERDLAALVEHTRHPLAVRSSSLLEDSYDQPFAGIYRTFMLANNAAEPSVRLAELTAAVKLVFASTFSRKAKAYLAHTPHRAEEEKMAVVVQRLVGRPHGRLYYPDFAGVACSHNYYPVLGMKAEDGLAAVALGFGKTVVEGGQAVRFSPAAPRSVPQFSSTAATLDSAQREFYALELDRGAFPSARHEDALVLQGLDEAARQGTLAAVGSVYSPDNDAIYDGIGRPGVRLVTFAPILKGGLFPLPGVLRHLLALGNQAMSCPVEIEFAVNLGSEGTPPEFAVLQIRPLVVEVGAEDLDELLRTVEPAALLCSSEQALGQGRVQDIRDVVYVKPGGFDRAQTVAVAAEVEAINRTLAEEGRPYLLIGPGRWGTADRWLGIPVEWHQIAGARVILETELDDVPVTPSEGTHFFQNITSFGIGYLTVHRKSGRGFVDFGWLAEQPARAETRYLRHVRLERPLDIRVDGRSSRGVILKTAVRG
ncbi:MAG: PEP/pyruvate-binding domain-containing protein [Thermoanaerobaculales bacterium]